MKKSTTFGAVLCSAALAAGMAMPAFAAGSVGDDGEFAVTGTGNAQTATGSTTLNMSGMKAGQLSAVVPLTVTVAVPAAGGAIVPPTAGTYKITNTCDSAIKVTKAKAVSKNTLLDPVATEALAVTPDGSSALNGKFYLAVSGNSSTAVALTGAEDADFESNSVLAAAWKADAKGGAKDYITLELSGKVAPNRTGSGTSGVASFEGVTDAPFAQITYTIAKFVE